MNGRHADSSAAEYDIWFQEDARKGTVLWRITG